MGLIAWWVFSFAVLAWALAGPGIAAGDRGALKPLLPLYLAGLPLAHVGLRAVNRLALELYLAGEFVPSILAEAVWLWGALAVSGWLQWFVLLPLVVRLVRRLAAGRR